MLKNNLQEVRKQRGLSQLRLSFLTGISPGDISRIENGWVKPYPGWRKRLGRALGVSEAELFPNEKSKNDAD
jgi:transcriptional regulator with XRE-family HTH domain